MGYHILIGVRLVDWTAVVSFKYRRRIACVVVARDARDVLYNLAADDARLFALR